MPIRTPDFDGTTSEGSWERPTFEEYVEGYFRNNPDAEQPDDDPIESVDEAPQALLDWAASLTFAGDSDADTFDGVVVLPAVVPETMALHEDGLEAVLSRAPQTEGISAEDAEEIQSRARTLLEEEFGRDMSDDDEDRSVPDTYQRQYEQGEVLERSFTGILERAEDDEPIVLRFNRGSTTDAHGTRFDMSGADLSRFKDNPIVRFAHGEDPIAGRMPVARAENVRIDNHDLLATLRFDEQDEMAQKVESKLRRGFLNAGSIAAQPTAEPEMRSVGGEEVVAFPEWELRGLSVVDIPSNPDALAVSRDGDNALAQRLERLERMMVGSAGISDEAQSKDDTQQDSTEQETRTISVKRLAEVTARTVAELGRQYQVERRQTIENIRTLVKRQLGKA